MDKGLRTLIKILLAGTILLILAVAMFAVGFGSAYFLTERGILPSTQLTSPLAATPIPSPSPGLSTPTPAPTPTQIPIPTPASSGTNEDDETFQLFWEVWDLVQTNYYGDLPDMQQITYAAIRGMLSTLEDQHTAFIEPKAAAIMAENATGQYEGIGAFVRMDEAGKLEIVGFVEEGPAEPAGVLEGDRVLEVDGTSIVGISLYEAIGLIRGPAGTEVTLLIERAGVSEPFEIRVARARLDNPIIKTEMREDGVGYIRLYEFSATATDLMEEGLEELLAQNPQGIVLDLRGNPGGWLDQAIKVADLFLSEGIVVIERWSDGTEQSLPASGARPGDPGEDIPLVVLVDGGSASASEIVAGALQDQKRAILVGEPTFGKGSVQRPFTLSDGSELRVTIARWFTPNDRAIHGEGLAPDIEVPWPEEDLEPGEDPQLERAAEYLLNGDW
jgi:carboxyl-terminal processing protease